MPIKFTVNQKEKYFEVKHSGIITDEELYKSYSNFLKSKKWVPGYKELTNLEDADLSKLSPYGVEQLSKLIDNTYKKHKIVSTRNAIFTSNSTHFGIIGIYEVITNTSSEFVMVFDGKKEAIEWLKK